jgi:hypothetical protein
MPLSAFTRRALAAPAVLAFAAAAAAPAQACNNWNIGKSLRIEQQNGFAVDITRISRDGKSFEAAAKYSGGRGDASGSIDPRGRFNMNVTWDNGSVGVYTAHVEEDGEITDGRTFDRSHPANWSTWSSRRKIACGG